MPWLERLFGQAHPRDPQAPSAEEATFHPDPNAISLEELGVEKETSNDQLARRVALALDEDPNIEDLETVYIAQQETTVVFKGKVPDQETLDELIKVAQQVEGVTSVDADQIAIGTAILTANYEDLKDH